MQRRERKTPLATRDRLDEFTIESLLTADEERSLAERIATGDLAARNELVERNLALARWVMPKYVSPGIGMELADFEQCGRMGLMDAANRYNPEKGRFSTFARHWILMHIRREIYTNGSMVRTPAYLRAVRSRAKGGIEATKATKHSGFCLDAAHRVSVVTSLNEIKSEDGHSYDPPHRSRENTENPWGLAPADVLWAVDMLPERQALFIRLRFGLDGEEKQFQRDIAERFGLNRKDTGNLKNAALSALREILLNTDYPKTFGRKEAS